MEKLVILCLLVSFSFGETLCEYFTKQVDKDLSKISMALEDNQPSIVKMEYEIFKVDVRSAIVECDGKAKDASIKLRDRMKEIMKWIKILK